ncbi:MAG: nitroreductase family deazaflavin-dependent oxidoreductase [Chloroflexota bacterium]|nr:nitroreductase family deazaflavin-dependent oxidoreductase [Chloroflexota bacterium]
MTNVNPNDWNQGVIAEFRANGGKVGGPFGGATLLLLTTTGAKTGRRLTSPVMYSTDGDRIVVFASKAGAPTHPDWYHNLVANPEVTVEQGSETFTARATVVTGEERDRLYAAQAAQSPQFAEYQAKTTRQIPVVTLERIA